MKQNEIEIKDWDFFGINEINMCVNINGVDYSGCLTEIHKEVRSKEDETI